MFTVLDDKTKSHVNHYNRFAIDLFVEKEIKKKKHFFALARDKSVEFGEFSSRFDKYFLFFYTMLFKFKACGNRISDKCKLQFSVEH